MSEGSIIKKVAGRQVFSYTRGWETNGDIRMPAAEMKQDFEFSTGASVFMISNRDKGFKKAANNIVSALR